MKQKLKSAIKSDIMTLTDLAMRGFQPRFDFREKNVFITGGSRGLGLSLAWNLLKRGASVTLVARDLEELDQGRNHLLQDFPKARVFIKACDVTDAMFLKTILQQSIHEMGSIDLLINNAGSILVGPFASMEREDFEAQMKIHLYAAIEATKQIVPHFQERGGGRILNICSLGGKVAVPHMLPYDVSKFALAGFSQGVSAELARDGIRVTTAYPPVMRTGSPIQAVFKGDHEKEFEWFQTIDHLPGISMSADRAAKKILDAVANGNSEIILSTPAKLRMVAGVFFPETMNRVMGFMASILPADESRERKTGADSQAKFDHNLLLKPLRRSVKKARETYNQSEHHDPEFNMGL